MLRRLHALAQDREHLRMNLFKEPANLDEIHACFGYDACEVARLERVEGARMGSILPRLRESRVAGRRVSGQKRCATFRQRA